MSEKELADSFLGDFNPEGSKGERLIKELNPHPITRAGLITIASTLAKLAKVPFQRNFLRRSALIIKWIDDHYDQVAPFKDVIHLEFKGD